MAQIGKHKVLLLVDSGSIGTFVSEQLVSHLKLKTTACEATTYKAADGGLMLCDQKVTQLPWFIQGHKFVSNAKVLPLKATYQVQTNLSVQTVQTNCGGEVGGWICKSVSNHTFANPSSHLSPAFANSPSHLPPQLVCTVCTERLVCTRYVPFWTMHICTIR